MFGLGLGLGLGSRGRRGVTAGPRILLSSATIVDTASVGDVVGTLSVSNGSGTYTFTLTSNPDSLFSISGTSLEVAASLTAGSYSITVQADNGVDTPISRAFLITVTHDSSYSPSLDFSDARNSQYVGAF